MRRRIFILATVLSLLLCAGTIALRAIGETRLSLGDGSLILHSDPGIAITYIGKTEWMETYHDFRFMRWRRGTERSDYRGSARGITSVQISFWLVVSLIAVLPACWVITNYITWPDEHDQDACHRCDYSLTGNTSGICPECGSPIPASTVMPETKSPRPA